MINIQDKTVYTDGNSHDYTITFYFGTTKYFTKANALYVYGDEYISSESLKLSESISTEETIRFGAVHSAQLTAKLLNIPSNIKLTGRYLYVEQVIDETIIVPYGRFYVESCNKTSYSLERDLIAYDYNYFLNTDALDFFTYSALGLYQEALCKAIFDKFELQYVMPESFKLNSLWVTERTYSSITYAKLLEDVGELNAGWWRPDRYGVMHLYKIADEEDTEEIDYIVPQSAEYENYTTPVYDSIVFSGYFSFSGILQTGTYTYCETRDVSDNPYRLANDNIFLNQRTDNDLKTLAPLLLEQYKEIQYTPTSVSYDGRPYMEVGDRFSYTPDDESGIEDISSVVLSQTISGIGGLIHKQESKGLDTTKDIQTNDASRSSAVDSYTGYSSATTIAYYDTTNEGVIDISENVITQLLHVNYTTQQEYTHLMFQGNVILDVEQDSSTTPVECVIMYMVDNEYVEYHKPTETWEDGKHTISLIYPFEVPDIARHTFDVYVELKNGTASIDRYEIVGCLWGQGLVGVEKWDGILEIEEELGFFDIPQDIPELMGMTDTLSVAVQEPVGAELYDSIGFFDIPQDMPEMMGMTDSVSFLAYLSEMTWNDAGYYTWDVLNDTHCWGEDRV